MKTLNCNKLLLNLPYRVDENTVAVLSHSIKNGEQKFVQTIYGNRKSNYGCLVSNSITETMYRLFVERLRFKNCVVCPHDGLPLKASLVLEDMVVFHYVDSELDSLVEKAIDGISYKSTQCEIDRLCQDNLLDMSSIVAPLGLQSILDLIQTKEC